MAKKAEGYLDGGPAGGSTIRMEEPHWAPLGTITVEVDGRTAVYVLATQPRPEPGTPWRYIPREASDALGEVNDYPTDDPYDD